jgi:hypothetical protein
LRLAVVGWLLAGTALTGCLGFGSGRDTEPRGGPHIAQPLRTLDCAEWRRAGPSERQGILRQLRNFAGGPVGSPAGHGAVLPDDRAYDLFEGYCPHRFAAHFRLYRLYTRAAAFGAR